MSGRKIPILAPAIVLALLGCRGLELLEATGTAPASPIAASPTGTLQSEATEGPIPPIATDSPVECTPSTASAAPPEIIDPLNAGDALVSYLNSGGSVQQLREVAQEPFMLNHFGDAGGLAELDLNGDGFLDVALSLIDSDDPMQRGRVYVAMCSAGRYLIAYESDFSHPKALIGTVGDLNGDSLENLMLVRETCGAHTCSSTVEILGWSGEGLRDLMDPVDFDLPSTGIELVSPSGEGSYAIYMTGNGVGSAGAGPYHRRGVLWEWDPASRLFRPGELRFLDSEWRIHYVHNGDRAFAEGDYENALDHYRNVIENPSLMDWPGSGTGPAIDRLRASELAAYARFRSILASLKQDDLDAAEASLEELLVNHPVGEPGEGFASMGEEFWAEYRISGDFNLACAAARSVAEAMPVGDLAPLDYGYSNPTYSPADMCPASN